MFIIFYVSIYRGLCSVVRRCIEKTTQVSYAVKIIDLTAKDNAQVVQTKEAGHNEIAVLKHCCDHPYISKYQFVL